MKRTDIYAMVDRERDRQDDKWRSGSATWRSDWPVKFTVLAEEVGEVAEAVLQGKPEEVREELVQVIAVAVSWLENWTDDVLRYIPRNHEATQNEQQPTCACSECRS